MICGELPDRANGIVVGPNFCGRKTLSGSLSAGLIPLLRAEGSLDGRCDVVLYPVPGAFGADVDHDEVCRVVAKSLEEEVDRAVGGGGGTLWMRGISCASKFVGEGFGYLSPRVALRCVLPSFLGDT